MRCRHDGGSMTWLSRLWAAVGVATVAACGATAAVPPGPPPVPNPGSNGRLRPAAASSQPPVAALASAQLAGSQGAGPPSSLQEPPPAGLGTTLADSASVVDELPLIRTPTS